MTGYIAGNRIRGVERFPLVMMLEPLHHATWTCTGCGRIREYPANDHEKLRPSASASLRRRNAARRLSRFAAESLPFIRSSTSSCANSWNGNGTSICTHGMFIRRRLHEFRPSSRFFFNVHLDGLEQTHDMAVERPGVFHEAIEGIKAAKAARFLVCSNTTIYKQTDLREIRNFFDYLQSLHVDGFMVSPAYSYAAVQDKEIFMTRGEIQAKFREASRLLERFNLMTSPIYMEFLRGERSDMMCTAWGNPTYNTRGWKGPCYLITDEHHETFKDFLEKTPWEKYGRGRDPRCEDCMVHVGYEPSAVLGANRRLGDSWKLLKWQLTTGG